MRPKVTFRDGFRWERKCTYWEGEFAKAEDADLEPGLAEIVIHWRAEFATAGWRPSAQDVKETLRRLRVLDDDQIVRALKALDPFTDGELWRLPRNPTPSEIRAEAERVLLKMKHAPKRAGRTAVQGKDVRMGVSLARWWERHTGDPATVWESTKESAFLAWATQMFHRAGRFVSASALRKSLQRSIKILRQFKNPK